MEGPKHQSFSPAHSHWIDGKTRLREAQSLRKWVKSRANKTLTSCRFKFKSNICHMLKHPFMPWIWLFCKSDDDPMCHNLQSLLNLNITSQSTAIYSYSKKYSKNMIVLKVDNPPTIPPNSTPQRQLLLTVCSSCPALFWIHRSTFIHIGCFLDTPHRCLPSGLGSCLCSSSTLPFFSAYGKEYSPLVWFLLSPHPHYSNLGELSPSHFKSFQLWH